MQLPTARLNVKSRRIEDIREVLIGCGSQVLEHIEEVSIDLWAPYKKLAEELMPNANITIVGYFNGGTTNGTVEGINNKLKLIKRRGYGFRNFDNFRLLSLLTWHFTTNSP